MEEKEQEEEEEEACRYTVQENNVHAVHVERHAHHGTSTGSYTEKRLSHLQPALPSSSHRDDARASPHHVHTKIPSGKFFL